MLKKKLNTILKIQLQFFPFLAKNNSIHAACLSAGTVKLGDKEHFDKEQIGVKEPFPVTNYQFTS